MEAPTFECYQCWKDERIGQVINKEAVSIEKATFLATHAPLNSITYEHTPQLMTDKSERGLLQELRRCAIEHRHTFAVVQGIPGTGKSHLIRWLKESYAVADKENQGNDVILLIERAQCNLRSTLLQIIESGTFEDAVMHTQLEKLKGATTELSKNALADNILYQLHIATGEVALPDEQLPRLFIRKRIEKFLLDFYVRKALKMPDGPIDRITRYLSIGSTPGIGDHEIPGFVAGDFKFGIDTLRAIRDEGGYKEARDLAEKLYDPDETDLRDELARYLNRLLNYAIGRTTALSADDLKHMFNELRRHLRKQNRQLALFIEDITAFTGLDVGLIDVLATQHTGENNREFCRLLSVIGITDNYFNDHFPDNMKERVTHRLTLNATQQGLVESDLLRTPYATADMAARYLNAMRLEQAALDSWFEHGARPERLPIACTTCQFKTTCHDAFGFVELASDGVTPQRVGLYPFNERAIWTMYQGLTTTTRTPRSLLNSVLEYVLESHGKKISREEFPPPARELGSDFKAPPLVKLSQRIIIDIQGGKDARRIESLVLFWGQHTVDATGIGSRHLVGGLPAEVYRAFGIPFIEGEVSVNPSTSSATGISSSSPHYTARATSDINSPPGASLRISPTSSSDELPGNAPTVDAQQSGAVIVESRQNKYTRDINDWLNGEKLQNYEKLGDLLVTLINSFIDWEAHGISALQVDDRLSRRRMGIEDQAGKINTSDCLLFKRSPKLAGVLQALADISEGDKQLAPETLGGHLAFLSCWLYENESLIVDFVQRPTSQSAESVTLTTLLFSNCILLACLQGELEQKVYSTPELLSLIIEHCVKADTIDWQSCIDDAQKTHGRAWVDLMKGADNRKNNVRICRHNLLQMLNKAQGGSQDVRFIDAALALDTLQAFEGSGWTLPPIEAVGSSAAPAWLAAYEVYSVLSKYFAQALFGDREAIKGYVRKLGDLTGSSEPEGVFQAINDWIDHMKRSQKPYKLEPSPSLKPTRLSRVKSTFEAIIKEQSPKGLALRLSGVGPTVKDVQEHLQYFENFQEEVSKHISQSQHSLIELRAEVGPAPLPPLAEQEYNGIEYILTRAIEAS